MSNDDDDFPPPRDDNIFDRLSLAEADAHRIDCAAALDRDLRSLASDVLFLSLCLQGRSRRIDQAARARIRRYIDFARLLIAALPAGDGADLDLKLAALTPPEPLVAEHANLRAMLESGARADIQRLKLANPPKWIVEWMIT